MSLRCLRSLFCVFEMFAESSLARLCPCFSFRPQCRDGSIWRFRFLRSCCVGWFSRRLVLRLFPLPCHAVCHTFVWARAAHDQTLHASNAALSAVFVRERLLPISADSNAWQRWIWRIIKNASSTHSANQSKSMKDNMARNEPAWKPLKQNDDPKAWSGISNRHVGVGLKKRDDKGGMDPVKWQQTQNLTRDLVLHGWQVPRPRIQPSLW